MRAGKGARSWGARVLGVLLRKGRSAVRPVDSKAGQLSSYLVLQDVVSRHIQVLEALVYFANESLGNCTTNSESNEPPITS